MPPDNAAIDILQYSTTAALFTTADSLYAIISEKKEDLVPDSKFTLYESSIVSE